MMMMMVTVKVPGQTTARGNILVDSFDTIASSSGRGQAINIITITSTSITPSSSSSSVDTVGGQKDRSDGNLNEVM